MSATATDRRPKVGLYPGLSRAAYESIPAINISSLEHFEKTALHAREAMLHPSAPSGAMEFGTALHCAILEPLRFSKAYVAAPKVDRRTNVGKQAWAEFEAEHKGSILMDAEEFLSVSKMRDSVWEHPVAKELLSSAGGKNEVAVVFENEETGLVCKGLIDRIGAFAGWSFVTDVKSTLDASPRGFSRSIKAYHYGAKAAFYLDGCNIIAPRPRRFAWIVVEKTPPYAVALYEPDEGALAAGRAKYHRWLRLYQEAITTNIFPGYQTDIFPLTAEDTEWRS